MEGGKCGLLNQCLVAMPLLTVEEKGLRGDHTGLGEKDNLLGEVWEQGYNQKQSTSNLTCDPY